MLHVRVGGDDEAHLAHEATRRILVTPEQEVPESPQDGSRAAG